MPQRVVLIGFAVNTCLCLRLDYMIHHTASPAPPCGGKRDAIYIGGESAAFHNGWESIGTEASVKR
jgi:hypothetical protein